MSHLTKNRITHQIAAQIVIGATVLILLFLSKDSSESQALTYRGQVKDTVELSQYTKYIENQERDIDHEQYNTSLTQWGVILGSIITLVGVVLNYVQKNHFEDIHNQLSQNNEEHKKIIADNQSNYNNILESIREVKDLGTRKNVIFSFRDIINGYTRMANDSELKPFIDAEGERLITFAEEIMTEHFTQKVQEQALVKIDYAQHEQCNEAKSVFGIDFYIVYETLLKKNIAVLKEDIMKIASDEVLNHKYARFKNVCENYLHKHLMDVLRLYLSLKIK